MIFRQFKHDKNKKRIMRLRLKRPKKILHKLKHVTSGYNFRVISSEKNCLKLSKKYSRTNSNYLHQLFCNCQAINTPKNIAIVEKYRAIFNLNAKIYIQKPKLAF